MSIEQKLRHWLKGVPEEAYPQLATRAALRCMPAIARSAADQLDGVALSTFRLLLSAQVIVCRPDDTQIPSMRISERDNFRSGDDAAQAAYHAAESAFRLANSSLPISGEPVTISGQSISFVDPLGSTLSTFLFAIVALADSQVLLSEGRDEARLNRWQFAGRPLWLRYPFVPEIISDLNEKLTENNWSFWSRWYERAMAGDPLPWDLQREVALIPDEIWQRGPDAVAERIAEIEDEWAVRNFPQAEELVQQEDSRFEVRPLPFDEETFLDRIFADLDFAVTLAVDTNHNDFNQMCTAYKYLRHTSESCRDDPNAIEQNFGIARSIIEANIARADYVTDDSLRALTEKLERYELQMRADHPHLREAFERRLAQKIREAEDPLRQQIAAAITAEETRTTGRLQTEMALDAETFGSVISVEAQARALRRAYARSAMMNIMQRASKMVHDVEGGTVVKAGKIIGAAGSYGTAGYALVQLVQWLLGS